MKKIVHIFNSVEYSGAERMIFNLREFYNENFYPIVISTLTNKGEFFDDFSLHFKTYHKRISTRRGFEYLSDLIKFISFYRRERVDIVHIHPSRRFLFNIVAARIGGVRRIVRQIHNHFTFTGFPKIKERIVRHFAKFIGVKMISISNSVSENEKKEFGIKTEIINNFFDEKVYFPKVSEQERQDLRTKLQIRESDKVIISVGSCIDRKQHDHILYCIEKLKDSYPEIKYLHVGDGPRCVFEEALAKKLGIVDNVKFLGNISNVRDCLVASDLYLMTSLVEGSSIATLEAMACRVSILVYQNPGLIELGFPSGPGFSCQGTVNDLSLALKQVFADPLTLELRASACYSYAICNYASSKIKQQWLSIYQN